MRDEETGTFWQQVSGQAVSGPLQGAQLELVVSDELTFDLWRRLNPAGTVLAPNAEFAAKYEKKDWEARMAKGRAVLNFPGTLRSRDQVVGLEVNGASRAYEVSRVTEEMLVLDRVGSGPVLLVVGPDGKSIRAFRAPEGVDFYRKTDVDSSGDPRTGLFLDSKTGSEWSFEGCAVAGKSAGQCLTPVTALRDFWFDWRNYHPATTVFRH